jgi:photosystem II stability/assembly factor-like uncharacterized protein
MPPSLAFIDRLHGWVSGMSPVGISWVYETIDGNKHWRQISDQNLQGMVFVDLTHGFGRASNHFFRTTDGGGNWADSELTQLKFIDKIVFLNAQVGWVAGSDGQDTIVLRTSDGGVHWDQARILSSVKTAEVRDLYFLSPRQGWLITWPFEHEGTRLYRTRDGGATWTADPDPTLQGAANWMSVVRFVGDALAFGFGRELASGSDEKPFLLYSRDAGDHWQRFSLPHSVYDCQALEGNLLCSAHSGETGFWVLKIHPSQ